MECPYHKDLLNEVKKISSEIGKLQNITVKNGNLKTLPLTDAVGELWECSVILRDFARFHILCRKYHLYKLFTAGLVLLILFLLGISVKDIILKLIT
jgi:hypothetical protein